MRPGPPYFPSPSFFIRAAADGSIIYSKNSLYKKEYRLNRCIVPGSNGIINLSIPLKGGRNNNLPFQEVVIDQTKNWWRDHYRTLESVYGRSPFFYSYADELQSMFYQTKTLLFEWNMACLDWILLKLKLENQIKVVEYSADHSDDRLNEKLAYGIHSDASRYEQLIYQQVFQERTGFINEASILDLLFSEGPDAGPKIRLKSVKP